ncbi:MAG: hypothetical protein ACI8PB_002312 [Desulforhopalus sp.]|jgi:hypothetical protein
MERLGVAYKEITYHPATMKADNVYRQTIHFRKRSNFTNLKGPISPISSSK